MAAVGNGVEATDGNPDPTETLLQAGLIIDHFILIAPAGQVLVGGPSFHELKGRLSCTLSIPRPCMCSVWPAGHKGHVILDMTTPDHRMAQEGPQH